VGEIRKTKAALCHRDLGSVEKREARALKAPHFRKAYFAGRPAAAASPAGTGNMVNL
jgi:hypothetical protein